MLRREFLLGAGMSALAGRKAAGSLSLKGNRFLTLNSAIRVNQMEVSRTRALGLDEAEFHTPTYIQALRDAVEAGWPGARMTWSFSWLALHDKRPNYHRIRDLVAGYNEKYGDELTFTPGAYFPNVYNTREQVNRDLHEGLALVSAIVGRSYRPRAVIAGFLSAANLRFLAEDEDIHVCQGNIWSQYAFDDQDGDGSICYPYYASREHFCKPAQGPGDFIDCATLDGWTCDFIAARRAGFADGKNSRLGVGPIETIGAYGVSKGTRQILATTAVHFDDGFERNGFAWVTNQWEAALPGFFKRTRGFTGLEGLTRWLAQTRKRWGQAKMVTAGEFGQIWRREYNDNSRIDYRFLARGTGIGGSDETLEIRWYMNRDFRLALLRDWKAGSPARVIDFTRYDVPAEEPKKPTRGWSLMGRINQKGVRPQDRPVPLSNLQPEEREIIRRRYPDLVEK